MAKTNVRGICKLCRKMKVLCKSHYLGRALEALSRESDRNAIVMTPDLITRTPRQLWAHLLCSDCEQRLNRHGESKVLKLLNGRAGFALLELMKRSTPMIKERSVIFFSGGALGFYFITFEGGRPGISFFDLATKKTRLVYLWEKRLPGWVGGIPVSPDGKYLLFPQLDEQSSGEEHRHLHISQF
jgi:hypothetical protein